MKYLVVFICVLCNILSYAQPQNPFAKDRVSKNIIVERIHDYTTPCKTIIIFENGDTLHTKMPNIKYGKGLSDKKLLKYITKNKSLALNESQSTTLEKTITSNKIREIWVDNNQYGIFHYEKPLAAKIDKIKIKKTGKQYFDIYTRLLETDSIALYRTLTIEGVNSHSTLTTTEIPVFLNHGTNTKAFYYLKVGNKSYDLGSDNKKAVRYLKAVFSEYPFFYKYSNQKIVKKGKVPAEKMFLDFIREKWAYDMELKKQKN